MNTCGRCGTTWVGTMIGTDMHTSDDCAEACATQLAAVRAELSEVRQREAQMAKFIVMAFSKPGRQLPSIDHACTRCIPDGPMVHPGFVCARHIAQGIVDALASHTAAQAGKDKP